MNKSVEILRVLFGNHATAGISYNTYWAQEFMRLEDYLSHPNRELGTFTAGSLAGRHTAKVRGGRIIAEHNRSNGPKITKSMPIANFMNYFRKRMENAANQRIYKRPFVMTYNVPVAMRVNVPVAGSHNANYNANARMTTNNGFSKKNIEEALRRSMQNIHRPSNNRRNSNQTRNAAVVKRSVRRRYMPTLRSFMSSLPQAVSFGYR